MGNSITVTYQKGRFNIISSVNHEVREEITGIDTSKKANDISMNLVNKYSKEGIKIDILELW